MDAPKMKEELLEKLFEEGDLVGRWPWKQFGVMLAEGYFVQWRSMWIVCGGG